MRFADIQTLDAELRSLVGKVRRGLVEFLRRLDIFDREQAFAALACSSTWEYLVRKLHLAEGTAYRRLTAMRLIRKFPQLEVALAEGLLNTTQLGVLSSVLTAENVDDLVRRATHLSKRETEELVVAIQPRTVPADGLRKLPVPTARPATRPELDSPDAPGGIPPVMVLTPAIVSSPAVGVAVAPLPLLAPLSRAPERSRVEPVADGRWQWRIGLDRDQKEKLDRLTGFLAHKYPDGDLQGIFDQMLSDSFEKHGKRLGFIAPARPRPIPEQEPTPGMRQRVPLPVKCRAHNQYRAFLRYGRAHIERCKAATREAREERNASRNAEVSVAKEPVAGGEDYVRPSALPPEPYSPTPHLTSVH